MRCEYCGGSGYVAKHLNCEHSHPYEQYIYGCNEPKQCPKCHGYGTTGVEFVKASLLTISLESSDIKARSLARQALEEYESKKEGE